MTDKIMKRLQENYDTVVNQGYEVVGVFLQGSQNYKLEYEGSDIDCKAVVLPKFNDFVLNNIIILQDQSIKNISEHLLFCAIIKIIKSSNWGPYSII